MPKKISGQTPGEKLLSLYSLLMLQDGRLISLKDIAAALDCSKQTALRLLDQMEASGFGKMEEPTKIGREHYYRLSPQTMERFSIGARELSQLLLCRKLLIHLLPESAEQFTQGEKGEAVSRPAKIMYKGYIDYSRFESLYAKLLNALQIAGFARSPTVALPLNLPAYSTLPLCGL